MEFKTIYARPSDDYVQSANTLFHFVKEELFLKDILAKKALLPRYCKEDVRYLGIKNGNTPYEEIAILQKCFCDIPFHKLTEKFYLHGIGDAYEKLKEEEQFKISSNNTHTSFYGSYGIAFSKEWGESHNLQPVHYINENSDYVKDFQKVFNHSLNLENLDDLIANDLLNRLSFMKPVRGIMERKIPMEDNNNTLSINFLKNFHDEKEWRYVPSSQNLDQCKIPPMFTNSNKFAFLDRINNISIPNSTFESLWLKFELEDIKYIIVPNANSRNSIIKFILELAIEEENHNIDSMMDYYILISKIIVLDDIRKDW